MYTDGAWSLRKPLEGSLVEIHGLEQKLEPSAETKARNPLAAAVDVNGEKGRAIGWSAKDGKYVVETFDGAVLGIGEENLKEYFPPVPEEGGFDVAWPSGPHSSEEFAADVVTNLQVKGYCLVKMFSSSSMRRAAVEESAEMGDWRLPAKELEAAYLGSENVTKYAVLPQDDFRREPAGGIQQCDRILSNVGLFLRPLTEDLLGFTLDGRTGCNVRVPLANSVEERLLRPSPIAGGDEEATKKVHGHVNFLALRRVKTMYFVEAEGGEVVLHPHADAAPDADNAGRVRLPLSSNLLLLLLPDRFGYTYRPQGDSLLLQTWFMSQPPLPAEPESRRVVQLPELQQTERVHFTSLHLRIPGGVQDRHQAWSMWISGTDGCLKIPSNRFDIDVYYNPDPFSGLLYTNHSATMIDYFMDNFDHEHFNIPAVEAARMGSGQRNLMEVGAECLYQSGYTKETLWGYKCGVYIGDKNTDRKSLIPPKLSLGHTIGEEIHSCSHSGFNSGVTAARLSYSLNLKGPVTDIDTACSSALVAMGEAMRGMRTRRRGDLRPTASTGLKTSLVMGMDLVDAPYTLFAYCATQMVSVGGRSFTFDESANGFLRGDGVGGCVLELSGSDEEAQEMLACLVGANVNQDGKSASLSAPHGPSQQQCIKASMLEAGLVASEITIAECHGTGTALGDPIEVGALRETMKKREVPMIVTSAKSNFGHTEAAAGICGIGRCLVMLLSMSGAPNLHLKCINPHIEFIGYPALFISEAKDCGRKTGISGVSSFGVGGTNARGDIWARSIYGARASDVVLPTRQLAFTNAMHIRIKDQGQPGPGPADELFLMGSWDGWTGMAEMESTGEGEWTATVVPGDVYRERFRIVLNRIPHMAFYPAWDEADPSGEVLGPDWEHHERSWTLDARSNTGPSVSAYKIRFSWGFSFETGEYRRISWEPVDVPSDGEELVDGRTFEHSYWIAATWTAWKPTRMAASDSVVGMFETKVRLGTRGVEEFQILRDQDWKQAIYPAAAKALKTSVPVRGPDSKGGGKAWVLNGNSGDEYTIYLQLIGRTMRVQAVSPKTFVKKIWASRDGGDDSWHDYWVVTARAGQSIPMHPDGGGCSVFRCRIELGEFGEENFQISVDHDWGMMLHPAIGRASLAENLVCGPDAYGDGLNWTIGGPPGGVFEIVLDRSQELNLLVSWSEIEDDRAAIDDPSDADAPAQQDSQHEGVAEGVPS